MNKILLGMAGIAALMMASGANAGMKLGVDDISDVSGTAIGSFTFESLVSDNGAGDTLGSINGVINSTYVSTGLEINVATGSSNLAGSYPQLQHLTASMTTLSGPGAVTFALTDTGFTDIGSAVLQFESLGGLGDFEVEAWVGHTDGEFELSEMIGSYSLVGGSLTTDTDVLGIASSPFSLTLVATLTHFSNGTSSVDTSINVPEPSVLALFGAGLFGLGLVRRDRKSVV